MVTLSQIEQLGQQIGREFHPDRVILFGSHAAGRARADSDVDLLVVMPCPGKAPSKSAEIRLKVDPPFPVDIIVRTPQAVQTRLAMGDSFMRDILQRGKVLYEATDR